MTEQQEILDAEVDTDDAIEHIRGPANSVVAKAGQAMDARQEQNNLPAERQEMTAMEMVGRALEMGVSAEILQQMMDLRDREEASRARKAFNEAFAAFKAEAITVGRNRKVTDGPLKGRSYAELVSFVEAATPALSKHGLSASWDITRDEKDWIEVTCTIEHVLGGSKKVALGGPPDTGGAKNVLQARISTVTYLERATFKAACGLAEQGDDDDGRGGGKASETKVNPEQIKELQELLDATDSDIVAFCQIGKLESLADMPAKEFPAAKKMLEQKKSRMQKERAA